jgi:hypothetical protein
MPEHIKSKIKRRSMAQRATYTSGLAALSKGEKL